ncbi:DUF4817 domain-containing protein [Trichonephila clavipes]|nr:DUF4817 domain-containing protein [Trichonephila clavipes]
MSRKGILKHFGYFNGGSREESSMCVAWFIETKSDTQTQRNYRTTYGESPPSRSSIREWYHKIMTTVSVEHKKGYRRPRTSEKSVERIRETFRWSPTKSVRKHPGSYKCQDPRYAMCFMNDCDLQHTKFRLCMR